MGRKSKNEKTIQELLSAGSSPEEIVSKLGISKSTTYKHIARIRRELTPITRNMIEYNPAILYSKKVLKLISVLESLTKIIVNMEESLLSHVDYDKELSKEKQKLNDLQKKIVVFHHYCGKDIKCMCCGEKVLKLLTLDHKNDDGKEHREVLGGENPYDYLIRVNFVTHYEFQVLCYNCNLGRYRNGGTCPHKDSQFARTRILNHNV